MRVLTMQRSSQAHGSISTTLEDFSTTFMEFFVIDFESPDWC